MSHDGPLAGTARARLRAALSEDLVPALLAAGFKGPAAIRGNGLLHEYRRRTATGVQVLTIQLEKRQLPRFILLFHIEPEHGFERVIAEGGTVMAGCLKAKPGPSIRCWFRADRSWFERVVLRRTDTLEREAVRQCLAYLPEVEAWWSGQVSSRHIVSWPVTYAGAGRAEP